MPAHVSDPNDYRVVRWNGLVVKKFARSKILEYPVRLFVAGARTPSQALQALVRLLREDDRIALRIWEAL